MRDFRARESELMDTMQVRGDMHPLIPASSSCSALTTWLDVDVRYVPFPYVGDASRRDENDV